MANPYYTFSPSFVPGTKVRSDEVNTQLSAIETAFDQLPADPDSLTTGRLTYAGATTGSSNAYVAAMPNTRSVDTAGDEVVFLADRANTGAATLNVDSNGARSIVAVDGSALAANDIVAGLIYVVYYDAANTRWQMINTPASYVAAAAASAAASASSASASSTSASASSSSASASSSSASASSTSASASSTSETNALASENKANQWAEEPEDSEVETGEYSAFHWAQKALAYAASGLPTATVEGEMIDFDGVSAYRVSPRARTGAQGVESLGTTAAAPSTGGVQDGSLRINNAGGTQVAAVGFAAAGSTLLKLHNLVRGGDIQLSVSNSSSGAEETVLKALENGAVTLYHNNAERVETHTHGVVVRGVQTGSPSAGAGQDANLYLTNASGVLAGYLGFGAVGATTLVLENTVDGGDLELRVANSSSVSELVVKAVEGGAVSLYHNALEQLATRSNGISVKGQSSSNPATGGTQDAVLTLTNSSGSTAGVFGFPSLSDDMVIRNSVQSGTIQIQGVSSAGASHVMALMNPDGSVLLYNDDIYHLGVSSVGISVIGALDNDPTTGGVQDALINLQNQSFETVGRIGYVTAGTNMDFRCDVDSATVRIRGRKADGSFITMMTFDPDSYVNLKTHNGAPSTATSSGAAGDVAWDSSYFYLCTSSNVWKRTALTGGW